MSGLSAFSMSLDLFSISCRMVILSAWGQRIFCVCLVIGGLQYERGSARGGVRTTRGNYTNPPLRLQGSSELYGRGLRGPFICP